MDCDRWPMQYNVLNASIVGEWAGTEQRACADRHSGTSQTKMKAPWPNSQPVSTAVLDLRATRRDPAGWMALAATVDLGRSSGPASIRRRGQRGRCSARLC